MCAGFEFGVALTLNGRLWVWGRLPAALDFIEPEPERAQSSAEALLTKIDLAETSVEVRTPRQLDPKLFGSHFIVHIAAGEVSKLYSCHF